jgi:hypothetical protein
MTTLADTNASTTRNLICRVKTAPTVIQQHGSNKEKSQKSYKKRPLRSLPLVDTQKKKA